MNDKIEEQPPKKYGGDGNIVKQTAKELGMTYKELGEAIGLSEASIKRLAGSDTVNDQVLKSIELLKEAIEYREIKTAIQPLKKLLK